MCEQNFLVIHQIVVDISVKIKCQPQSGSIQKVLAITKLRRILLFGIEFRKCHLDPSNGLALTSMPLAWLKMINMCHQLDSALSPYWSL